MRTSPEARSQLDSRGVRRELSPVSIPRMDNTEQRPNIITPEEADRLADAILLLGQIADRAWSQAHKLDAGQLAGRLVGAQDTGRLAGVASVAKDVLFDVVNVASAYCMEPDAIVAFKALRDRRETAAEAS